VCRFRLLLHLRTKYWENGHFDGGQAKQIDRTNRKLLWLLMRLWPMLQLEIQTHDARLSCCKLIIKGKCLIDRDRLSHARLVGIKQRPPVKQQQRPSGFSVLRVSKSGKGSKVAECEHGGLANPFYLTLHPSPCCSKPNPLESCVRDERDAIQNLQSLKYGR
jgi:hypothetical protein